MPELEKIRNEVLKKTAGQDEVRRKYLKQLSQYTGRDTIIYASDFTSNKNAAEPATGISYDDLQGFMAANNGLKSLGLDLIMHSPGGFPEAAEQIVNYLRKRYEHIRVIVPHMAMSAATMIACSADEIIMGKHSALGPIDPQIPLSTLNGSVMVPAHMVLEEFEQARKEILDNSKVAPLWLGKIQSLPFGFLKVCQSAIEMSKEKVRNWLEIYMFKEEPNRVELAKDVAEWLGNFNNHKTHGKPISIKEAKDHNLVVNSLEDDDKLQDLVLSIYHATQVTFQFSSCIKIVENQNGKGWYLMKVPPN